MTLTFSLGRLGARVPCRWVHVTPTRVDPPHPGPARRADGYIGRARTPRESQLHNPSGCAVEAFVYPSQQAPPPSSLLPSHSPSFPSSLAVIQPPSTRRPTDRACPWRRGRSGSPWRWAPTASRSSPSPTRPSTRSTPSVSDPPTTPFFLGRSIPP